MSKDSGPVMPLEQRCVHPGYWVIEGWDVHRIQDAMDSRNFWWMAALGSEKFTQHSLADVREEIRNRS